LYIQRRYLTKSTAAGNPCNNNNMSQAGDNGAFSSTLESPTSAKPIKILRPKGNFDKNEKTIPP